MAQTNLRGNPVQTAGESPTVGADAPAMTLTKNDLSDVSLADYAGQNVVVSLFPSVDTPVCATSIRTFNERAAALDNTVVLNVSADLPFAQGRFCGAEGIENVEVASAFRHPEALDAAGTRILDGPMAGLSARAVFVVNAEGKVVHSELVDDIVNEPDYDAALASLS